jgi:hypothetical protein
VRNRADGTIIGTRRFVDGADREVYQNPDGRQYVYDDCALRVYGIWILTEEAEAAVPVIAPASCNGNERPS